MIYKLGMMIAGVSVFISLLWQMDMDADLMKEQIGFSEKMTKRKFKWYVFKLLTLLLMLILAFAGWWIEES